MADDAMDTKTVTGLIVSAVATLIALPSLIRKSREKANKEANTEAAARIPQLERRIAQLERDRERLDEERLRMQTTLETMQGENEVIKRTVNRLRIAHDEKIDDLKGSVDRATELLEDMGKSLKKLARLESVVIGKQSGMI